MAETKYDVQGNPIAREEQITTEDFTPEEMEAIQICADNIDAIISTATNGPLWLSQGEAAASRAETAAASAELSATAAANSAVGASSSASAAAASELNAVNAASAASASASAADASADRAEAAAGSSEGNPFLLPDDGQTNDVLWWNPAHVGNPALPAGDWGPGVRILDNLEDVVTAGSLEGFRLTLRSGTWVGEAAGAATRFDALQDTSIVSPQDGQIPVYRTTDQKWHNEVAASGGGSSLLKKNATLVGPTSYKLTSSDLFAYRALNVAAGNIEIEFDDSIAISPGFRAEGFMKLINAAAGRKVTFKAGTTSAAIPGTFGTVIAKGLQSGGTGVALTNAQNVAQAGVIPTGLKCAVAVVYIWACSGANTDACDSPGFVWNGLTATPEDWLVKEATPGNIMRGAIGVISAGDIAAAGMNFTFQPLWTDYGGNGRVNAYCVHFIPYYGANLATPVELPTVKQLGNALSINMSYSGIAAGNLNREMVYCAGRRNNTTVNSPLTITGATQSIESTNAGQLSGGLRMVTGHEAGVAGAANTAVASGPVGASNLPWIDINFAFIPAGGTMRLNSRGNKALEMTEENQMLGFLYDPQDKVVELQY